MAKSDPEKIIRKGTKSHPVHRKAGIHKQIRRSKAFWRYYFRLNLIFLKLEMERKGNHDKGGEL